MAVETVTVAVHTCGYREEAPHPDDLDRSDPDYGHLNYAEYRKGDYGHDYCRLNECPGCEGEGHDSWREYANRGIRIYIRL